MTTASILPSFDVVEVVARFAGDVDLAPCYLLQPVSQTGCRWRLWLRDVIQRDEFVDTFGGLA